MSTPPKARQSARTAKNATATPHEDGMTTAEALTARPQAESPDDAPDQTDAARLADLETQLMTLRRTHEEVLQELALTRGDSDADRSEGAAPASDAADYVYVYANLPSGQIFTLPGGVTVAIKGVPASLLRGPDGERLKGGKYGVTRVKRADWEAVLRLYGGMGLFREGLIFAANGEYDGAKEAEVRRDMRHGLEPLDPESRKVKTRPASREETEA